MESIAPATWSKISLGAKAFHEKAGRSQVASFVFRSTTFFSRRVATTVSTLPSALSMSDLWSLGASWVFSFQEAGVGSHFLGRALREQAHEVRLIPARFV